MKKLYQLSAFISCVISLFLYSSCSDHESFEEATEHSTTFRIYECNSDFTEEKSASSRFVSEGAIITIWELNDNNGYDIVKQLKTGLDGVAIYNHNDEIVFYTVEKNIEETKKNLATLQLRDNKGNIISIVKFQVEGIFTSQEDIDTHAKFNFGVDTTEYRPKIGALKFKDINNDGYIDIEDSISKSMFDIWSSDEEIVYITSSK